MAKVPALIIPVETEIELPPFVWDSPIQVALMRNPLNKGIPGMAGVFEASTKRFLGVYSDRDCVVSNATLIATFETALASLGLEFTRHIFTLCGGSVMHAVYNLTSSTFTGPDGKPINLRIRLVNSYNGSTKVSAVIEALRLICLNGMMGFKSVFAIAKRHSPSIDMSSIVSAVAPQIESGAATFASAFRRFADMSLSDEQGGFVLRNLFRFAPSKFSGVMARKMEAAWNNPTGDERDSHNTVWGLYNAATRVFRDLPEEKTALAQRNAAHLTMALIGMTEKNEWLARLMNPVSFDDAYARDTDREDSILVTSTVAV